MSDCTDDNTIERQPPQLDGFEGDDFPIADAAILIKRPKDGQNYKMTARQDVDEHTALTQAIASYILGLDGTYNGRSTKLRSVIADWADRDDGERPMPSAAVHSEEEGVYQLDTGPGSSPPERVDSGAAAPGDRVHALTCSGIYQLNALTIDVRCEDKIQRRGIRKMLLAGMWPNEWKSGFDLVIPQYHNAIASFLCTHAKFDDSTANATAGIRRLSLKLWATIPVYRVHELPLARIHATGTIKGG